MQLGSYNVPAIRIRILPIVDLYFLYCESVCSSGVLAGERPGDALSLLEADHEAEGSQAHTEVGESHCKLL